MSQRQSFLQYPSNLATSIAASQRGGDSMDGYYGHWMMITIYEPEKSQISIGEEQAESIGFNAGAALATPFLLNFLGVGGGLNALLSGVGIGALGLGNVDDQQFQVATSGRPLGVSDIEELISKNRNNPTALEALNNIKTARTDGRIPESRATLGLGLRFKKSLVNIALPMPKQIKSNYGFEYSETDFSGMKVINSAIAFARSKGIDFSDGEGLNRLVGEMPLDNPDAQGILSFLQTIPASAVDEGFKLLGLQPNLLDYTRAGRNQAKVPYSEKLFKSVKRRSFDVEYTFLPKNQEEVLQIHEIIKTLKAHAHPSKTNNSYYYGTPSEFIVDFQYLGSRNIFLPQYGRLAIESIDVDYGSSQGFSTLRPLSGSLIGNVFNVDTLFSLSGENLASPTEINLKISFSELELLTKERIEEGY